MTLCPKPGAKILTLDTETAGVMRDSKVWQMAYRIDDAQGNNILKTTTHNFLVDQMDTARVSRSGLSRGIPMSEYVAGVDALSMEGGGAEFVEKAKGLYQQMLEVEHVSGHNVLFDINKMSDTLEALPAFKADSIAQDLRKQVFEKINSNENFLIDTSETMRSYLYGKALSETGNDTTAASSMVQQLLSREAIAQIDAGGKIAPVSVENIALNTNLFQLMEQNGEISNEFLDQLKSGSHQAFTDIGIQEAMDRYRRTGELNFRFNLDQSLRNGPLSDFEKYAMNVISRSQAVTPTTNLASTQLISDATYKYLTEGEGYKGVVISTKASELGLSGSEEGFLRYSKARDEFLFNPFGTSESQVISDAGIAKNKIISTLEQARMAGEGTDASINIAGRSVNITRNIADESIMSLGMTFGQQTIAEERRISASIGAGITAGDEATLIRSLGLTNEQFGLEQGPKTIMERISNRISGGVLSHQIYNPMTASEDVINQYYKNVRSAGLPFESLSITERALSVKMAEATAPIAAGTEFGNNAELLSEMGLSYFRGQITPRIGSITSEGELFPSSKIMAPFESLFDFTAAEASNPQSMVMKAFNTASGAGENILSTDLNKFTLSYLSGSGEVDNAANMSTRVNLIWGANNTLSKEQTDDLATHMLSNIESYQDTLRMMNSDDAEISSAIRQMTGLTSSKGLEEEFSPKIHQALSQHIRDRGIVTGFVEGDPAENILESLRRSGIDVVDNEIRMLDLNMRLAFYDKKTGTMVMSAISSDVADKATGRTSAIAQEEAERALQKTREVVEIFNDSAKRRQAQRIVQDAKSSTFLDRAVDLSKQISKDYFTPMTDVYKQYKKPIGFATLGLAAASVGYYTYKKYKEQKMYEQTMAPMPTESRSQGSRRPSQPTPMTQGGRRDPLVTAGIVGNLDRNKIGHTSMGPNKYSHLYGG